MFVEDEKFGSNDEFINGLLPSEEEFTGRAKDDGDQQKKLVLVGGLHNYAKCNILLRGAWVGMCDYDCRFFHSHS